MKTEKDDVICEKIKYKICYKCKENLCVNNFDKDKSKSDGLYSRCKRCKTKNVPDSKKALAGTRRFRQKNKENFSNNLVSKKVCFRCKKIKSWKEFTINKSSSDGLSSVCKECESIRRKKNRKKKKSKFQKREREYYYNVLKKNIQSRIAYSLRNRLKQVLKNNYKCGSAVDDLGCSVTELKVYLELKFKDGMSWENWGRLGWHIDHIIPLSSFDLTDREQFLKACHYTNLQPLWAKENLSKGDRII
jgi:hypothetical protein